MWQEPKTDWYGGVNEDGLYEGDRFNAEDFNRIKNNLVYLREFALKQMYENFNIINVGKDRTPKDYFYAEDINNLEKNLVTISEETVKRDYGDSPVYFDNGPTMDFNELNRLESATLDIYLRLTNQSEGRRKFTWNFGMKEGL